MHIIHREAARKLVFLVVAAFSYAPLAHGFGSGAQGCSSDCTACHSVKKEEADSIISRLAPGSVVASVGPSPVRGLYQMVVKKGAETALLYLDFSKKFLIAGRVIDTEYRKDVTKESLAELRRIDPSRIPLDNALVLGSKNGERTLYVFTDPDCPYCAGLHRELAALASEDSSLTIYILLMPLEMHPEASWKADAIVCAAKERMDKGLQLLEESFAGKAPAKIGCGTDYGNKGKEIGKELGIDMTPTMILSNGRVISGMRTSAEIRSLLDDPERGTVTGSTPAAALAKK